MYKVRNNKVKLELNLARVAKNNVLARKRRLKKGIPLMNKAGHLV